MAQRTFAAIGSTQGCLSRQWRQLFTASLTPMLPTSRRALGLNRPVQGVGTLSVAAPGDVALVDPEAEWTVEPERFASKGRDTPLAGRTLRGRVVATVYEGRVVYQA